MPCKCFRQCNYKERKEQRKKERKAWTVELTLHMNNFLSRDWKSIFPIRCFNQLLQKQDIRNTYMMYIIISTVRKTTETAENHSRPQNSNAVLYTWTFV